MAQRKYYYLAVWSHICTGAGQFVAGGFTAASARHRACDVVNAEYAEEHGEQPKGHYCMKLNDWGVLKINLETGLVEQEWIAKV